jgi:hypothetical protein
VRSQELNASACSTKSSSVRFQNQKGIRPLCKTLNSSVIVVNAAIEGLAPDKSEVCVDD